MTATCLDLRSEARVTWASFSLSKHDRETETHHMSAKDWANPWQEHTAEVSFLCSLVHTVAMLKFRLHIPFW